MEGAEACRTNPLPKPDSFSQSGRDRCLLVPSCVLRGSAVKNRVSHGEQASLTLRKTSWPPPPHMTDACMCVCVSVSICLVPWSDNISFPRAHVFVAICHDVISPGPEQSYLSGRSRPVRGAPSPVLLTPMHDLFCHCLSLITAWQLWPRDTEPSNHNGGWGRRCVWVWCCCCLR